MKDDQVIWRGVLLIDVLICLVVALYPGFVIKVLSYGRKTTQDINGRLLVVMRIMAAISAIYGVGYLAWEIIRK